MIGLAYVRLRRNQAETATFLLAGLTAEAQQAQESLMALPPRFRKIEERRAAKKVRGPREHIQFSWLFNRTVAV